MKSYCWDRERDAGSSSSAIVAESRVGSELASADVLESHTSICATTMRPFLSASRSEGTMSPNLPRRAGQLPCDTWRERCIMRTYGARELVTRLCILSPH